MGILGEKDAELVDLIGVIEEIQQRARQPIRRGATTWVEIFAAAHELVNASPHRVYLDFSAHGVGLVSHEAPRLTDYEPWAYDGYDASRPLEADMVLSIETTMAHPKRGFITLPSFNDVMSMVVTLSHGGTNDKDSRNFSVAK
jgi:Xaa-Pro aminopeptidase